MERAVFDRMAEHDQVHWWYVARRKILADLIARERTTGAQVESDEELDAFIDASLYVAQHPVGTCAMGMGARSVVDPELRVIGVEGLRVADASVMPTVPGGNTNLPAIMIGEKAADLIKGRSLPRADLGAELAAA